MTLNPQEQETTVEDHGKELFRDHIGQFLFFAVSFLGTSDVLYVFPNLMKSFNISLVPLLLFIALRMHCVLSMKVFQ